MTTRPEPPRPLLLPQNRKLRHLQGLSVRNLSFVRPSGKAADDADLLNKSPSKLDALREGQALQTSRSSENLVARPAKGRRRSTTLAGLSPLTRQKKLQLALESRVADSFFSLHCPGDEEPVYISEVVERATVRDTCPGLAWPDELPLLVRVGADEPGCRTLTFNSSISAAAHPLSRDPRT